MWESFQHFLEENLEWINLCLAIFGIWLSYYLFVISSRELHTAAKSLNEATTDSAAELSRNLNEIGKIVAEATTLTKELNSTLSRIERDFVEDIRAERDKLLDRIMALTQNKGTDNLSSRKFKEELKNSVDVEVSKLLDPVYSGEEEIPIQSVEGVDMKTPSRNLSSSFNPIQEIVDRAIALLCAGRKRSFRTSNFFEALASGGAKTSADVAEATSILLNYKEDKILSWPEIKLTSRTDIEVRDRKHFHLAN